MKNVLTFHSCYVTLPEGIKSAHHRSPDSRIRKMVCVPALSWLVLITLYSPMPSKCKTMSVPHALCGGVAHFVAVSRAQTECRKLIHDVLEMTWSD